MTQKKIKKNKKVSTLEIVKESGKNWVKQFKSSLPHKPIKLLSDIIFARRIEDPYSEKVTKGGIILTGTKRPDEYNRKGSGLYEVLEHGPGAVDNKGRFHPIEVKKGDRIYVDSFTTVEHDDMGRECVFTREKDVMAVLE